MTDVRNDVRLYRDETGRVQASQVESIDIGTDTDPLVFISPRVNADPTGSGTIAQANIAQPIEAPSDRNGFLFYNVSDAPMWIDDTGAAVIGQPSLLIPAGAYYRFPYVPMGDISVICATAGKAFSIRSW